MINRMLPLLITAVMITLPVTGYRFAFEDKHKISFVEETVIEQKIFRSGDLDNSTRLKTVYTARKKNHKDGKAVFNGNIQYLVGDGKNFKKKASRPLSFYRTVRGLTRSLPGKAALPRENFPSFPGKDISLSDTWTAPVVESFNLLSLGIKDRFQVTAQCTYRYVRDQELDGHKVAVILYHYRIATEKTPSRLTKAVSGSVVGVIFWKKEERELFRIRETFDISFTFNEEEPLRCKGLASKSVMYITERVKRQLNFRKDLNSTLGDNQDIRFTKNGVVLNLGNILFQPGKSILKLDAMKKLIKVAEFLKKKKTIRAKIEGHTDNKGSRYFNNRLSRLRAMKVYKFFVEQADISRRRLSYRGWGPRKPIADNKTDTGRKKNRRVEIIFMVK